MKIFILITLVIACSARGLSQIGFSTALYAGPDAKLIENNWSTDIQVFIPIRFRLKSSDSTKITLVFQPALKWEWYDFKKNLIVSRQNGYTSFTEDTDPGHSYRKKFLRTSSQMKTTSFYMPVNLIIRLKKPKHFLVAPGIYGEYIFGGKFKRRYNDGSPNFISDKFKDEPDFYGFQQFQYGLCGHITYKFLTLYGVYALTPLFKKGESIEVYKYTAGISVNFFWKRRMKKSY